MRGKIALIQVTEFISLEDAIKIRNNVREFVPLMVRRRIGGRELWAVCRRNTNDDRLPPTFFIDANPNELVH